MFERGDYKFVAGDAVDEVLWLTGVEGLEGIDSVVATKPAKTSLAFPQGGYFVMRDSWNRDSNYLLFDCGPHGSLAYGHAHADALSIDLAANGRRVLIDPGTYTYTGSKELRDWFRGSIGHNTLTVDGESSSLPDGPFSWKTIARCSLEKWLSDQRFDFVSGQHDGFMRLQDPVTTKREILFVKGDYWVVRDMLVCSQAHRVDVRFHYDSAPEAAANLAIRCFGNGRKFEEEGFVSHSYGQKEPAKITNFSATLSGSDEVITFLLPREAETECTVTEVAAQEGRAFEVHAGNCVDLVIIPAVGAWVWTRNIDGQTLETFSTN
jgi:hypothetical protein